MRQFMAGLLLVLPWLAVGCLTDTSDRHTVRASPQTEKEPPSQEEFFLLDVALVEKPFGDRYLNEGIWELGDEQAIDLELKPTLEDNGFRVARFGSVLPEGLQALLASPRTCPDPRQVRVATDHRTRLLMGPPWSWCKFNLKVNGQERAIDLRQAQCLLEVTPEADEGRTKLEFMPQIRHGRSRIEVKTEQDPNGLLRWAMEAREPAEEFPELRFALSIAPGEYIVIGTRLDRLDTLGGRCFVPEGGQRRMQRLLVVRAAKKTVGGSPMDESMRKAPPLALRAGLPVMRGSSR